MAIIGRFHPLIAAGALVAIARISAA